MFIIKNKQSLMTELHHTIIIGAGSAAYTAGVYLSKANIKPLIFKGDIPGGHLLKLNDIDDFMGWPDGISGEELMSRMEKHAIRFGSIIINETVESIDLDDKIFTIKTNNNKSYNAQSVIIATGITSNKPDIVGIDKFWMKSIFSCVVCNPIKLRKIEHKIIVVGGGTSALEDALFLTNHYENVTLVHRNSTFFKASAQLQYYITINKRLTVLSDTQIININNTTDKLENMSVINKITNETYDLPCDIVYFCFSHDPNTQILTHLSKTYPILNNKKHVITIDNSTKTNISGLFACGTVRDSKYQLTMAVVGDGCIAASDVIEYLQK